MRSIRFAFLLRLRFLRGLFPCVKAAECGKGYPVHVCVHGINVPQKQRFDECIVVARVFHEPPFYHLLEHPADFHIGKLQAVPGLPAGGIYLIALHL